jgi:hypothetical protein
MLMVLVRPKVTLLRTSTISICLRLLRSQTFHVPNGGLSVTLRASWLPDPSSGGGVPAATCPQDDYFVSLEQVGLVFDHEISTSKVPAGKSITLTWKHLPADNYYLNIFSPGHAPGCCLKGDISFGTFDAPRPSRRVMVAGASQGGASAGPGAGGVAT